MKERHPPLWAICACGLAATLGMAGFLLYLFGLLVDPGVGTAWLWFLTPMFLVAPLMWIYDFDAEEGATDEPRSRA